MATFSPQGFLVKQGWEGPGSGLRKGSIKKPVTVAHKTNLKGIGKERDTGYAWWDDVFSMVANKKKGGEGPALRKTSTGIHSPLPPGSLSAVSSQPTSGTSTPVASTSGSHFHQDIIGHAKLEAARKEFYAKFLRGRPLEGTVREATEEIVIVEEEAVMRQSGTASDEEGITKEEKKKLKQLKKAEKEKRKAEKEERRQSKKEKKDRKGKRKAEEDAGSSADAPVAESAAQIFPVTAPDVLEEVATGSSKKRKRRDDNQNNSEKTDMTTESKAERKARKEEKKRRKLVESNQG